MSGRVRVAAVQINSIFWVDKTKQANKAILIVQETLEDFLGQHGNKEKALTIPVQVPVDHVSEKNNANIKVLLCLVGCLDSGYYPNLKKELRRRLRKLQGVMPIVKIVKKSPW